MKHAGHARWFRAFVALVFLASTAIPAFMWMDGMKAYAISPEAEKVIGSANKNLSAKFSFDEASNKWQFNKSGAAALAANIAKQQGTGDVDGVAGALSQLTAKQVGGSGKNDTSLYSVDLPVKAKDGITYYDNVNKLSFKMVPDFGARDGKLVQDRIVYPFGDGAQVVYTAKANGMKEDIVLSKYIADTLRYSYNLELPDTLAAKLLDDGSIGIYSANVALFGNISFSNDADKARVMDARKNGTKDNLVFTIPAPFIKDQTGNAGHTKYLFNDNRVTVVADQLKNLKYPLTVDPSVTITSSSAFQGGNNEGMAGLETADQISRGGITGGTTGTWDNAGGTAFTTKRSAHDSVAYNGYLYVLGGKTTASQLNDVQYAPIDGSGNVGTWQPTSSFTSPRTNVKAVAYNGYMYILGGASSGTSVLYNDVQYAPICDGVLNTGGCSAGVGNNGKLGTWQYTYNSASSGSFVNGFTTARYGHTVQIYNGYLYVMGGCTDTNGGLKTCQTIGSDVQYAPVNANGTVGTWASANTGAAFTTRYHFASAVYNGYLYVMGGCISVDGLGNCNGLTNATQYAPINTNGTLGAWVASANTFVTARNQHSATVYNGYLYISGGNATYNDVQYAPINANGTLGAWTTTTTFNTTGRYEHAATYYKGYLYITGGCNDNAVACGTGGSGYLTDTRKAKIDEAGAVGSSSNTTTAFNTGTSGRQGHSVAVAYGYMYVLGGDLEGVAYTNTVRQAQVNADGTVGPWSNGNSFVTARAAAAVEVYNGYLYLIGGVNTVGSTDCLNGGIGGFYCRSIEWASINPSTGALSWQGSTFVYSTQGRAGLASAISNGYMYVLGGVYANNATESTEVNYAQINANGTLGTFNPTTAALQTARGHVAATAVNGRIYIIGGRLARTNEYATPAANGNITSWGFTGGSRSGGADTTFATTAGKDTFYLSGGLTPGPNVSNQIQTIKINADGTMGNWTTSNVTMNGVRRGHASVVHNDNLYIVGGNSNNIFDTYEENVWYHRINNGGSGAVGTWGAAGGSSSIAAGRSQTSSATYSDSYVYVTGGCTGVVLVTMNGCSASTNDIQKGNLNADYSVGAFSSAGTFPTARYGHSTFEYNGYLYVVGGCSAGGNFCSGFLDDIQVASINPTTGALGTWGSAGTTVPGGGRYAHTALAYNGYLYVVGGCTAAASDNCTGYDTTVRYAAINSNGTVSGTWNSSNFSTGRFGHSAVIYAGRLHVLGGCSAMSSNNCTTFRNDVQSAPINANGSLGSWSNSASFDGARYGATVNARNGYVYLIGGCSAMASGNCSTVRADTQITYVTTSGYMDRWTYNATSYPTPRLWHNSFTQRGHIYIVAGIDGAGSLRQDTQAAMVNSMSRIGRYSKLLAISPTTDVAGVYYNGTLPVGSSVTYRVAPTSGVFGAITAAAQGTGSEPTPQCGMGTIYYVQLRATIDDSTTATFPESNEGNVTDFTVYYRLNATPTPNLRMTGGKWFWNETLRPLDTCKQPNV